jgi:hypothetical protein
LFRVELVQEILHGVEEAKICSISMVADGGAVSKLKNEELWIQV